MFWEVECFPLGVGRPWVFAVKTWAQDNGGSRGYHRDLVPILNY